MIVFVFFVSVKEIFREIGEGGEGIGLYVYVFRGKGREG